MPNNECTTCLTSNKVCTHDTPLKVAILFSFLFITQVYPETRYKELVGALVDCCRLSYPFSSARQVQQLEQKVRELEATLQARWVIQMSYLLPFVKPSLEILLLR